MDTFYDESVLDFELNFFHQKSDTSAPQVPNKLDKQRKAITIAKKKTIATDSLIKKYYATKETLEQTEKNLLISKEECKQVCIDYRNTLDKCAELEKEAVSLKNTNSELENKYCLEESRFGALQSHVNQLQSLVKNHETLIEALKIENQLEKENTRDHEKKVMLLQSENNVLLKHICIVRDVLLGKKKLNKYHKDLLQKYDKLSVESGNEEENSDNESFIDDNIFSPLYKQDEEDVIEKNDFITDVKSAKSADYKITKEAEVSALFGDDIDRDSDSNELVSVDTGCGSSIEFSDSEKCLRSPDFIADGPLGAEFERNMKIVKNTFSTATSPITVEMRCHIATSPIIFENCVSHIAIRDEITNSSKSENSCNCNGSRKKTVVDKWTVTSPIKSKIFKDASTSCNNSNEAQKTVVDKWTVTSPIKSKIFKDISTSCTNSHDARKTLVDKGTVTSTVKSKKTKDVSTSCDIIHNTLKTVINKGIGTSPIKANIFNDVATKCDKKENSQNVNQEKAYLEKIDSVELISEDADDSEVRMILHSMRSNLKLISPIPTTPTLSPIKENMPVACQKKCTEGLNQTKHFNENLNKENDIQELQYSNICRDSQILNSVLNNSVLNMSETEQSYANPSKNEEIISTRTYCNEEAKDSEGYVCKDAVKIREENKFLQSSIHELTKEIMNIKKLLTSQRIISVNNANTDSGEMSDVLSNEELSQNKSLVSRNEESLKNSYYVGKDLQNQSSPIILRKIIEDTNDSPNHNSPYTGLETMGDDNTLDNIVNEFDKVDESDVETEHDIINICNTVSEYDTHTQISIDENKLGIDENNKTTLDEDCVIVQSKDKCIDQNDMMIIDKHDQMTDENYQMIDENEELLQNKDRVTRPVKHKKLTKLEKIKRKLLPKRKIKTVESPQKRRKCREPPKPVTHVKTSILTESDSAATLNDKDVYEKAIKVMNALKLKNKNEDVPRQNFRRKLAKVCDKTKTILVDVAKPELSSESSQEEVSESLSLDSPNKGISTRSRRKCVVQNDTHEEFVPVRSHIVQETKIQSNSSDTREEQFSSPSCQGNRKRRRNASLNITEIPCKRILRSSVSRQSLNENESKIDTKTNNPMSSNDSTSETVTSIEIEIVAEKQTLFKEEVSVEDTKNRVINYSDLDLFSENDNINMQTSKDSSKETVTPDLKENATKLKIKENIFCTMLQKHVRKTVKCAAKKIPDSVVNNTSNHIEESIKQIRELSPAEAKVAMDKLVEDIKIMDKRKFILGLMKYLKDPERKIELLGKEFSAPAPPMTKSEQVLLYVITQLKLFWPDTDVVNMILVNVEYNLFRINQSPDFNTIESMSHFYAVVCRYVRAKSRLRLFMLDAMYCLQFKSMPLIKQCLEVWMHVLPLAHMGIAKCPLVVCLVYLLHFYKCEDRFNRVQEIRNILEKKYSFKISGWTEKRILDTLKSSILEMRDNPLQRKMLRMAFIIISKRRGPEWCFKNIVKNLLHPLIEREDVVERMKHFCISILGPLLKPFPNFMKVHCEVVMNQLMDTFNQSPSASIQEAIITSLLYLSKHNQNKVIQTLLFWNPQRISPELEELLRGYIREKPFKSWRIILSKMSLSGLYTGTS